MAGTWVAPDIPARQLRNARAAHRLPPDEPVWVLYDDTLFGSGTDGVVLTDRRLCFKHTGGAPRSVRYSCIDDVERERSTVRIGSLDVLFTIRWTVAHAQRVAEFLLATRIPDERRSFADRVQIAIHTHLGPDAAVQQARTIPADREQTLRRLHALPYHEQLVALLEDWVFTDQRFAWLDRSKEPRFLPWTELACANRMHGAWALDRLAKFDLTRGPNLRLPLARVFDALLPHTEAPMDPLLAARIDDDPTDDAPRLVLLDWLVERGSPRGQLGLLQANGGDIGAVLAHHGVALVGPVAWFHCTWRLGYWDEVVLYPDGQTDPDGAMISRILGHPSARFVTRVQLGTPAHPVRDYAVIFALRDRLLEFEPPCLRQLDLGVAWSGLFDEVFVRLPRLRPDVGYTGVGTARSTP